MFALKKQTETTLFFQEMEAKILVTFATFTDAVCYRRLLHILLSEQQM